MSYGLPGFGPISGSFHRQAKNVRKFDDLSFMTDVPSKNNSRKTLKKRLSFQAPTKKAGSGSESRCHGSIALPLSR